MECYRSMEKLLTDGGYLEWFDAEDLLEQIYGMYNMGYDGKDVMDELCAEI